MPSAIQWTDETWNPTVGCSRVSDGCTNCYAEALAPRLAAMGQTAYEGLTRKHADGSVNWTGEVRMMTDRLTLPLHIKKPKRIFVNSMSDLFHEDVTDEFIAQVFAVMSQAKWHTFQILTKRPERMQKLMEAWSDTSLLVHEAMVWVLGPQGVEPIDRWPLQNVWLGVSAENQDAADERIYHLLNTPAAVRFVSAEPLLGPIVFTEYTEYFSFNQLRGFDSCEPPIPRIDWVIAGAESGRGARPLDLDWMRSIRDQCTSAGVSFFFKQDAVNGRHIPTPELDGVRWTQFPDEARVPA